MFGQHDDNSSQKDSDATEENALANENTGSDQPTDQISTIEPVPSAAEVKPEAPSGAPDPATPAPPVKDGEDWQHPGTPLPDKDEAKEEKDEKKNISDMISPAGGFPKTPDYQYPSIPRSPINGTDASDDAGSDPLNQDLVDIRQKALGELAPLIEQLDLPPEEKFRAIMMVIQASDDEKLIEAAYEAAHAIEDDKTHGQALLDLVNEINYFTAPHENEG